MQDLKSKKLLSQLVNRPETLTSMEQPDEEVQNPLEGAAQLDTTKEIGGEPSTLEEPNDLGEQEDTNDYQGDTSRLESVPSIAPVSSNVSDITDVMRRLKSGQSEPSEQEDLPPSTLEDPTASIDTRKAALAQLRKKYLNID